MDPSNSQPDSIAEQWRTALLQFDSTLPRPVAQAMIQNVTRGPLGESLCQLEEGLSQLEGVRPEQITGSEARTVLAILAQMDRRVVELQSRIQQLWNAPSE
jgi:hypothetical protein